MNLRQVTILSLAALAALFVLARFAPSLPPNGLLRDFSAFYCAGAAIDAGADPYRAEPLGACERAPKPPNIHVGPPGLASPAPLPPFALAGFALLARLPYGLAAGLFTLFSLGCFVVTIRALGRLGVGPVPAVAALVLTDGYASLALGQIVPFALAALVGAAALLETARAPFAGVLAACALVEPHLAVPPLAVLAIARRETRAGLAVALVVLALAGVAGVGPGGCWEYLHEVLPAHARSEIANERQFSLTAVLAEAGVPAGAALALGEGSYLLTFAAGTVAALRLAPRFGRSLLILAPAAFSVVGGPFVHIVQMAAATPLALVLVRRTTGRVRSVLDVATLALATPWVQFATLGSILMPLAAAISGLFASRRGGPRAALVAACGAIALLAAIEALVTEGPPDPTATLVAQYDPWALAEVSWTRYVAAVAHADRAAYDLARAPTWLGALAVAAVALVLARGGAGSRARTRTREP